MYEPFCVHYHASVRNVISPFLLQVLIRNQTYKNRVAGSVYEKGFGNLAKKHSKNTLVNEPTSRSVHKLLYPSNTDLFVNEDVEDREPFVDFSLVYGPNTHKVIYCHVEEEEEPYIEYETNDNTVIYCDEDGYDAPEEEVGYSQQDVSEPEPYVDFSMEYACYETYSSHVENRLSLNRTTTNPFFSQTTHRPPIHTETSTEPPKSKKRRIFLEPRVVLADPKKGVRFCFEMPFIDVDETDEETILNTEIEENRNIWCEYFHDCTYGLKK